MSDLKITRMSGAGNTFLFWNLDQKKVPTAARPGVVRFLCESFPGFYTDGMVFLESEAPSPAHFRWDFYNADGSAAEMCGNAARCAALYFHERCGGPKEVRFETAVGTVRAQILEDQLVEVQLPALRQQGEFREFQVGKKKSEYYFINTGVPHVVVEGAPDPELAQILRRATELGPAGANVTFFSETSPGEVEAATFERGVENFTLSCGTGALAAAAFSREKNPLLKNHSIEMPGGSLSVRWLSQSEATLSGPTQFEFDLLFAEGLV